MHEPADSTPQRTERLDALTGLRFVAAAAIVLLHSSGYFGFTEGGFKRWGLGQAVSFFFILSGFVLTYAYPKLGESCSVRSYYVARFARIWPAHIAAFLLLIALLPVYAWTIPGNNRALALVTNLSLVHAWIPSRDYFLSFNGPAWSLSVEVFFYLLFPLLVSRLAQTWALKLTLSALLLSGIIAACNVMQVPPDRPGYLGITTHAMIVVNPAARLFEFILGMTVELLRRNLVSTVVLSKTTATLIELAVFSLAVTSAHLTRRFSDTLGQPVAPAGTVWIYDVGGCVGFALLILVMAMQKGYVSAFLARPIPVLLGEISYSMYLIHQILFRYYEFQSYAFQVIPHWLGYILFWILLLLLSHFTWLLVERPARSWIVRRWQGRMSTTATEIQNRKSASPGVLASHKVPGSWGPGKRILYAEVILLLGIVLTASYLVRYPPSSLQVASGNVVNEVVAKSRPDTRDVQFGGRFLLHGMAITPAQDGLVAELIWESVADEQLTFLNAIHLVDDRGNILAQADYPQDYAKTHVRRGTMWKDTVRISAKKLRGANAMALAVYDLGSGSFLVDRGPRDWDNHRLVLNLD